MGRGLQVTHSVIQSPRHGFQTTGNAQESCRPRWGGTTARGQEQFLILAALRDRTTTANGIRGQLRVAANVITGVQTILNRLYEVNMRSRQQAVLPSLARAHAAARKTWAYGHVTWTRHHRAIAVYSDGSRSNLTLKMAIFASEDGNQTASSTLQFQSMILLVGGP